MMLPVWMPERMQRQDAEILKYIHEKYERIYSDVIFSEDTRVTQNLLNYFDIISK